MSCFNKSLIIVFLLITNQIHCYSQSHIPSVSVESGVVVSTGKHAPFCFYSNQYGKISTKNNSIYLMPSIYRNFKEGSKLDYSYNLSPLLRYDGLGRSYMHQWYGELKFHFIHFTAGAKEEFYGNQDSTLSSGCIIWSKNARPMPKLKLEVPNYTPVPFTWKYLEFKGGMAHGWFDDNEYNKNVWLHHKYFYLRLGGKLPVHVSYGVHHFAQWGGTLNGKDLPKDLPAFKNIFTAKGGDNRSPLDESMNKLGNHIGSRNFGLEGEFKNYKVSIYWQTIFEDGSGKAYRNIKDGLWGICFMINKGSIISKMSYEFFNSTNQSGNYNDYWTLNGEKFFSSTPGGEYHEAGGNDNYFNHWVYPFGFTFKKMTLGTPLITSPEILNGDINNFILNNKVRAHFLGIEGDYKNFFFTILINYNQNWGTNYVPFSKIKEQLSVNIVTTFINLIKWNTKLGISFSTDYGKMYGNNVGITLKLKKEIF